MPELPEVETARRGVAPHLLNRTISKVIVRQPSLRWPVSKKLPEWLEGKQVVNVKRRAKFLLIELDDGNQLMLHLGMSGKLRVIDAKLEPGKHDHIDIVVDTNQALRFNDARRFGCCLWSGQPQFNQLLAKLGPEPLSEEFNLDYLWPILKSRKVAIKQLLMNNQVVVGVGNIYAAESLFMAGINPKKSAQRVTKAQATKLVSCVKEVLAKAIKQGGTTLRDFTRVDGAPGYFKQELQVYGREGEPCFTCGTLIKGVRQGQRATAFCPTCQT